MGASVQFQSSKQSKKAAAAALSAICPAWIQGGRKKEDLATAALDSAAEMSPQRALPLLAAMVTAVPEVGGSAPKPSICNHDRV